VSQDPVDEALKRHLPALPRPKGLPKRLERVYDSMGDRLAMRHHLDRYDEVSGGPSARGIDDELLRRMASYLLSLAEGRWRRLAKSIPALWKRGGREHRKIAGMLVANLPEEALGDQRWTVFSMLLQDDVGLAPVVDAAEEIRRATGEGPSEAWLLAMAAQAPLWHRYAAVIAMTGPPEEAGASVHDLVASVDAPSRMFERLRERWLERHVDARTA
jgi:hypothetical protein